MQNFNILATRTRIESDNKIKFVLSPFCDIYKNPKISSNYNLWFNNPEITKYNSHGLFPYKPDADINEILNDKSRIVWAIVAIQNPNTVDTEYIHIGNISLQKIDMINRSAEIACLIGEKEYWGKGIMTWALQQLINHGTKNLGLNRIWSGTAWINRGMIRVFEKLGFEQEGIFSQGMYLNGAFVDVVAFAYLPETMVFDYNPPKNKTKKQSDEELIEQIQKIRAKNNINWMDILRLAFNNNKEKVREIFKNVKDCDEQINNLSKELANNE